MYFTFKFPTKFWKSLYPFPHDKILDLTKLKAFTDDKLNVTKMVISVFDRVENIVGKGEIACTIFPQCFKKASFQEASKGVIVWEWVKERNSYVNINMFHIKLEKQGFSKHSVKMRK